MLGRSSSNGYRVEFCAQSKILNAGLACMRSTLLDGYRLGDLAHTPYGSTANPARIPDPARHPGGIPHRIPQKMSPVMKFATGQKMADRIICGHEHTCRLLCAVVCVVYVERIS